MSNNENPEQNRRLHIKNHILKKISLCNDLWCCNGISLTALQELLEKSIKDLTIVYTKQEVITLVSNFLTTTPLDDRVKAILGGIIHFSLPNQKPQEEAQLLLTEDIFQLLIDTRRQRSLHQKNFGDVPLLGPIDLDALTQQLVQLISYRLEGLGTNYNVTEVLNYLTELITGYDLPPAAEGALTHEEWFYLARVVTKTLAN